LPVSDKESGSSRGFSKEAVAIITSPDNFAKTPRDSKQETTTLSWLRDQNDISKFKYIWHVLRINPGKGLILVKRAQLKPIFLEIILEYGFVYSDASTVLYWINATVDGLGQKRILRMVRNHLEDAPLIVFKVLYWLPRFYKPYQLKDLRIEFENKYPNFRSTRITGIHATGQISKIDY
jgi:hypothetical protein